MQTEPDVLTDHNELILSTNIERVVTGRDTALKQIEQLRKVRISGEILLG